MKTTYVCRESDNETVDRRAKERIEREAECRSRETWENIKNNKS